MQPPSHAFAKSCSITSITSDRFVSPFTTSTSSGNTFWPDFSSNLEHMCSKHMLAYEMPHHANVSSTKMSAIMRIPVIWRPMQSFGWNVCPVMSSAKLRTMRPPSSAGIGSRFATHKDMLTLARRNSTIRIPLLNPAAKPFVVSIPMLCDAAKVPPNVSCAPDFPRITFASEMMDCLKLSKHSLRDVSMAEKKSMPGSVSQAMIQLLFQNRIIRWIL